MNSLKLTISLADQKFDKAKSIGIFNVSLGLCHALARRSDIQRLTLLVNDSFPEKWDFERVILERSFGRNSGKWRRFWWDQFGVYKAARRTNNNWLLLPKGYASFLRHCPVKLATYIHDVIPEFFKEFYPRESPLENFYFHKCLWASIAQSRLIFVNSHFTASQIHSFAERCRLRAPQIEVVGIGFNRISQVEPTARLGIITLASRWPFKRTDLAIAYLSRWQKQTQFKGCVDWIGELPCGLAFPDFSNWHLHNRLGADAFNRRLAKAKISVYFSDYEGFGMPPVEAAIAGACPVYSDIPATREVMQEAGHRFANNDYQSFAAALDRALKTPASQINAWGEQLLVRYSWQTVADRVIHAFNSQA